MSLTLPTFRRRRRHPSGWSETDAAALAVADLTSIHLQPEAVRDAAARAQRAHGGPDGVRAELSRRLAGNPREAARTARTLQWARRVLSETEGGSA